MEDALKHPNWEMGRKITIDSSTLVNKGLEVIEAKWLFDVDIEQIQVVVHPQSIIHSMVEYVDGAIMAELGTPDMKLPIQYALYYPERRFLPGERVDFYTLSQLTFEKPDLDTFYGLRLAFEAGKAGGSLPTVYNAANELKVAEPLIGVSDFQENGSFLDFGIKRISRLKKTASLYLYKMFLEYRGRIPYTSINLTGYSVTAATLVAAEKTCPLIVHIKLTSDRNKNRGDQKRLTWYVKREELQEAIAEIYGEHFELNAPNDYVELLGKGVTELSSGSSVIVLKKEINENAYEIEMTMKKTT